MNSKQPAKPVAKSKQGPRRFIKAEDLQDLYLLVKGSRFANDLIEAETVFAQGNLAKTIDLVQATRDFYEKSHRRTLRADPSIADETTRKKQRKYKDVLNHFNEVLHALAFMRDRELRRRKPEEEVEDAGVTDTGLKLPSGFREDYVAAESRNAEMQVLRNFFVVQAVLEDDAMLPNSLYYLFGKEQSYLVVTSKEVRESVEIRAALTGERLRSLAREKVVELAAVQRIYHVATSPTAAPRSRAEAKEPASDETASESEAHLGVGEQRTREVLEMGAFTQLLDAATRSGLVPNADMIAHVRDREFRLGDYQKASHLIESLYSKFTASATQRTQRLRREDTDISSGRIKMSPKDLQAKRTRDTAETQRVDRARNRFLRVLEGLRILMRTDQL